MDPAPLNPISPSRKEKQKGSTTGTLDPISSPNCLRERPSNFWLTSHHSRDLDALASPSLTPLSSAVGQVNEGRSNQDDSTEKVEELGERVSDEVAGPKKDIVVATSWTGAGAELADGLSMIKNSTGGSNDGDSNGADNENGVGISAGPERERRSRRSMTMDSDPAVVDLLHGRNVLDWTAADVLTWIRALPRGLAAFAEAEAFAKGRIDGKKLATLTLLDIKRKEFRHAKFKAKVRIELNEAVNVLQT